jgi:hypothetical protein
LPSVLEALDLTPLLLELEAGIELELGGWARELEDGGSALDEDTTAITLTDELLMTGGAKLELLSGGSGTRTDSGGSS